MTTSLGVATIAVAGLCLAAQAQVSREASSAEWTITGTYAGGMLGSDVQSVGDINRDGKPDFAISPSGATPAHPGYVEVRSGADPSTVLRTHLGESPGDRFGYAIAAADLNRDGLEDMIVSATHWDSGRGRIYAYSGADGALLYAIDGASQTGRNGLGFRVATLGDVDLDGRDDFAASLLDFPDQAQQTGRVHVYSGVNGALVATIDGAPVHAVFGHGLAGVGDINRDGINDLLVGAIGENSNRGRLTLYSGRDFTSILAETHGTQSNERMGQRCSLIGDLNRDGWPDLIVDRYQFGGGRIEVVSGRSVGGTLETLWSKDQPGTDTQFGYKYASAGDFNLDGTLDIIVGAASEFTNGRGSAYVLSGIDGSILATFTGEASGDGFGCEVAGGFDLDANGLPDVIIAAWHNDVGGVDAGRVYVFLNHGPCEGDFNQDGIVDFFDYLDFVAAFDAGCY